MISMNKKTVPNFLKFKVLFLNKNSSPKTSKSPTKLWYISCTLDQKQRESSPWGCDDWDLELSLASPAYATWVKFSINIWVWSVSFQLYNKYNRSRNVSYLLAPGGCAACTGGNITHICKRSTVIPTEYLHNLRRKGDLSSSQEIPIGEQQKSQTTRITCQSVRNYWSDCPQNQVQRVSLHDDVMLPFLLRLFYKIIFSYVPLTNVCDYAV
jgi:hypothetical protein